MIVVTAHKTLLNVGLSKLS